MAGKVEHFINAIKQAKSHEEVLAIWTEAASQSNLTLNEIISVHHSCGDILADAVIDMKEKNTSTVC